MNEFNELQHIWKTRSSQMTVIAGQPVTVKMLEKLRKLESFQDRINRIKLLVLSLLIVPLLYIPYRTGFTSLTVYIGLGIIVLGVIFFMWTYLKSQFNIRKLDFTADSIDFADHAIQMLEKQNAIFKLPFLFFVLALMLGFNVLLIGLDITLQENALLRAYNTGLIAVFAFIGYKIRMRRIQKEVTPVIHELMELKKNLNSEKASDCDQMQ